MKILPLIIVFYAVVSISFSQAKIKSNKIIAEGNMPAATGDKGGEINVVYGKGDSIFCILSKDGKSYTSPELVSVLPGLFTSATRGPRIAAAPNGIVITASTKKGNIFSFKKDAAGKWSKAKKVNDVDDIAKEGLMDLAVDGLNAYAVWLGANEPKGQKIHGAKSTDGGKTWHKNIMVYTSPDGTVCECCKPSVAVKGKYVYVMFRNWLNGNRDLYLIESSDGWRSFSQAQKLGNGSWKINGCPMDGGDLTVNSHGVPQTVWQREGTIYSAAPGEAEQAIGEGRSCLIETLNNKNYYAWTAKGKVLVMEPRGTKLTLGEGTLTSMKSPNNGQIICVWENGGYVHAATLKP